MSQIKISAKFNPDPYPFIDARGRVRRGNFCHACGKPLKDEVSIKRGYGPECWKEIPVIILLQIPGSENAQVLP